MNGQIYAQYKCARAHAIVQKLDLLQLNESGQRQTALYPSNTARRCREALPATLPPSAPPPYLLHSVWKEPALSTRSYVCAPKKSRCACVRLAGRCARRYMSR